MPMNFNTDGLLRKLNIIRTNLPTAMRTVGIYALARFQGNIISGGNGWPDFAKPPKRPHQLLWDTGTLLRSLTVGNSDNILQQEGIDNVAIGTNVIYAAAQNFGNPARGLPARPFLVVNAQLKSGAATVLLKALLKGLI